MGEDKRGSKHLYPGLGRKKGKKTCEKVGVGWEKAEINTFFLERIKGYLVARRSYAGKQ